MHRPPETALWRQPDRRCAERAPGTRKISRLGVETLPVYGLLKEYGLQEVKDLINRLIATGYLCLTESEYPVVKSHRPGGRGVRRMTPKCARRPPSGQQKTAKDDSLFQLLRTLRKSIADRVGVPPYVVFADSTLKEMCEYCPDRPAGPAVDQGGRRNQTGPLRRRTSCRPFGQYCAEHSPAPRPAPATQRRQLATPAVTFPVIWSPWACSRPDSRWRPSPPSAS